MEQVRAGLEEQLEEEMACSGQLAMQRDRLQAECSSLRLDMDELETALTSAEQDKQVSCGSALGNAERALRERCGPFVRAMNIGKSVGTTTFDSYEVGSCS